MKAVFIDRDGVICDEVNHLHKKKQIRLIQDSASAIRELNRSDYRVIVVTNQPVVARGLCTEEELKGINSHLEMLLKKEGALLDAIYYCPHLPAAGNNSRYMIDCECRKPKPGMLFKAKKDFNIEDLSECFLIGDKTQDIKAGKNAGCKTILVKTGYGGKDIAYEVTPDFVAKDLYDAVTKIILK